MKTLISGAVLLQPAHSLHNQSVDIAIDENGIISDIQKTGGIQPSAQTEVLDAKDYFISSGFTDMRCRTGVPGKEHRENLKSLSKAALKSGFTKVCLLPETEPCIDNASTAEAVLSLHSQLPLDFYVYGALTKGLKGESLSEMQDLHQAGCIAFTDGKPVHNIDIIHKSLIYLQHIDGLLITRAESEKLSAFGMMNEGIEAVKLGMKGIPNLAESLEVEAYIRLLEYTGGRLHITCVSTAESVELIAAAKAKGLKITADIAAHQLAFIDADLTEFDSNLKVKPPFRTEANRRMLIEGLKTGVIDAVVSDHNPLDAEEKDVEFDKAKFGISSIETTFQTLATFSGLSESQITNALAYKPCEILGLETCSFMPGAYLNATVFNLSGEELITEASFQSYSKNSPFIGKTLKGSILASFA